MNDAAVNISSLLQSQSDQDRRQGIMLLIRLRHPRARQTLESLANQDPAPAIRYMARKALAYLEEGPDSLAVHAEPEKEPDKAPPGVVRLILENDLGQRLEGIRLATQTGNRDVAGLLLDLLDRGQDERTHIFLLEYFARHGRPSDLARLVPQLSRESTRLPLIEALAKAGGIQAIPYLAYLMQDPDPHVRKTSRTQMGKFSRADTLRVFEEMLKARETWMRDSATYALSLLHDPEAVRLLEQSSEDTNEDIRRKAIRGIAILAERGVETAKHALMKVQGGVAEPEPTLGTPPASGLAPDEREPSPVVRSTVKGPHEGPGSLGDPNPRVRIMVLTHAIESADSSIVPHAIGRLEVEENTFVLSKLLIALGHLSDQNSADILVAHLDHQDPRVVASAIESLNRLGYEDARSKIRPLTKHKSPRIRANALLYCSSDPSVDLRESLRKMLTGKEYPFKLSALYALSKLPPGPHCEMVETVLGDINDEVREKAFNLLEMWAKEGVADARAMLEMCTDGEVAIKQESLYLQKAPAPRRLIAFAIDFLLVGSGTMMLAGAVYVLPGVGRVLSGIVLAVGTGFFFVRDAFNGGRGLAKKMLGLRTVDLAANRGCTKAQSLLRQGFAGLGLAGPVEIVMMHTDPAGRRMADWMVNTQVIDEKEQPLSLLEGLMAAFIYLFLAVAALALLRSFFTPPDRQFKSRPFGYTLQLPAGWEFERMKDNPLQARRRSLLRGEELNLNLYVSRVESDLDHSIRAVQNVIAGRETPIVLKRDHKDFQEEMLEVLRRLSKEIRLEEPKRLDRVVAGVQAFVCDIPFETHGQEGVARGIRFKKGNNFYEFLVTSLDRSVFQIRENELDQLLAELSFPVQ